jgi:pyrimidine-specific ribonucleoside hydrolase
MRNFARFLIALCLILLLASSALALTALKQGEALYLARLTKVWMDPFDGPVLDSGWMWMRPDSMNWGLDTSTGRLRIVTQPQSLFFETPNSQENILLRVAPPVNFTITTHVAFTPTQDFQQAGLLVYRNDDNFVLVNRGYCSTCSTGGQGIYFDSEHDGTPTFLAADTYLPTTAYLRIVRSGSTYIASYRQDQGNWIVLGQVNRPDLSSTLVGISATNSNPEPSIPSINADYDFFQIESQAHSVYLPFVLRSGSSSGPMPVIVDDDGSPDGMIALLYLLRHPNFNVKAITVSNGEAHPDVFAQNIMRVLARLGRTGIPVAAGRSSPLEGNNAFPASWRAASDNFWGISLPEPIESVQPLSASQLIVQTVKQSSQPVTIFVSGPHTNLAEALRIDPSIASRIRVVQSMGGSIYVPGNIKSGWPTIDNDVAEWNIWVDPLAASEVISAGLSLTLVPLDATNQVRYVESDAAAWETSGTPEGILAAEILRYLLSVWPPIGAQVFDAVAAVNMTDPGLCWKDHLHLDIVTASGDQQGRTAPNTSQPANATVCLIPSADQIRNRMADILGQN